MASRQSEDDRYILEFITLGGSMKVTAIDPTTLVEASIIAPPGASQQEAGDLAVRKLHYLLEKRKDKE